MITGEINFYTSMFNATLNKKMLIAVILFGIGLTSMVAVANEKILKGTASTEFLNEGNKFQIHWYEDKEKSIDVTSFTDSNNNAVLIVEGKYTLDLPLIKSSNGNDEFLVYFDDATIVVDSDINIINIENNGYVEFDNVYDAIDKK